MVTDGKQVYLRGDSGSVTSLLEGGQEVFHFVLDIAEARDAIVKMTAPKRRRAAG